MKRQHEFGLAVAGGLLLAQRRQAIIEGFQPDLVVPVPRFWTKRWRYGTNSPEGIAQGLARWLGLPVPRRMLVQHRKTLQQHNLRFAKRAENVRGAFRVRRSGPVRDARVLLVDDILTTGATCSEAAKVLKAAGAVRVAAVAIARAGTPIAT